MRSIPTARRIRRRATPIRTFQYAEEAMRGSFMNRSKPAARIAAVLMLLSAANAFADPVYSISTPDTVLTGMVTAASVTIQVGAPSSALLARATRKLNGLDVTSQVHADGAGSMSGVVAGLEPGANVFQLWSRNSREPVAQLTVMKALAPAVTCASLAALTDFPVQPARITQATLTPPAGTTPEYCLVQGRIQERTGIAGIFGTTSYRADQPYGTRFEVRLPTAWSGRYMFQGSGGSEGGLPGATGQICGTAGLTILRNGFAVASQNGGHTNSELPPSYPPGSTTTDLNHIQVISGNMFFPDAQAVKDWGYNSIDVTTQTAKFLINAYYGRLQERSYFVGCSTSGRQGMAMSQRFPQHYDGIVAGDPFYLPPDISLSETWGLEQIISISPIMNGMPQYQQGFPLADQNLFTNAILAACDHLDGLIDGVIDNMAVCTFDPATFVFPSSGVYGSIAPGMPLQCTGDKTSTCHTPAQVNATKKIAEGPRTSSGERIVSPDGTPLSGYPFDGGFMQPSGVPTRDIGSGNSPPGNIGLGSGQLPLFWFATPDPTYNPLTVNYDLDIHLVTPASPVVNNSTTIGPYTGLSNTTHSRPLCPYPKTLRYNGSGDISQASSYACQ